MGTDKRTIKEIALYYLKKLYEKILKIGCDNCRYMCSCPDYKWKCKNFKKN